MNEQDIDLLHSLPKPWVTMLLAQAQTDIDSLTDIPAPQRGPSWYSKMAVLVELAAQCDAALSSGRRRNA